MAKTVGLTFAKAPKKKEAPKSEVKDEKKEAPKSEVKDEKKEG